MSDTSMIAGSKLEFSVNEGTDYIEILGIPEIPEFKEESGDRVTTTIRDTMAKSEPEMESPTELVLAAQHLKADANQLAFRTLARNKGSCLLKATYSDGDSLTFPADLKNYGITGGDAPSTKMWSCVIRRTGPIDFSESTS